MCKNEKNACATGKGCGGLCNRGAVAMISSHRETLGERLNNEVAIATMALQDIYPAVSIFGGARVKPDSPEYEQARALGERLSSMGLSVITGGGPGIMEAGNRGCKDAQAKQPDGTAGRSVGLNIMLPFEQKANTYQDTVLMFKQFASRKVMFVRNSMAFVACAGGVGTLDELFEILTLMQTKKMPTRPVILLGSKVWTPLVDFLKNSIQANGWMSEEDMNLFTVVDTVDEVVAALRIEEWPQECQPEELKKLML